MSESITHNRTTVLLGTIALIFTLFVGVTSDAGIGRNGISGGRIAAFGSIFVNGRELVTTDAVITIDGQPATESDLKLGQNVLVSGIVDSDLPSGVADTIFANAVVAAAITEIDLDELQVTVLGKVAFTDAETVFEPLSGSNEFADFNTGQHVSISGFRQSDGNILATRIEEIPAESQNLVVGTVRSLSGTTFKIDDLIIDFSMAEEISGFDSGTVQDGDSVRVRSSTFGTNGELIASRLEFVPGIDSAVGDAGEIEGLITEFTSASDFRIGGVQIATQEGTVFVGGGPANLTSNVSVTVRGDFDTAGDLVAGKVEIRGSRIRVNGQVESMSGSELTVLGVPFLTTSSGIARIVAGDFVRIRSFRNPPVTTPVLAEKIERRDREEDVRLQGFVSAIDANTVEIFGTAIHTTGDTRFFDANDDRITSVQFFKATTPGTFVKVSSDESLSSSLADVEISLMIDN